MVLQYDFSFLLLIMSTIMIIGLLIAIVRMKNKSQIHYVFACNIGLILIWCIGHILEVITTIQFGVTNLTFVYLYYFGLIFLPISLLFTGLIFERSRIKLTLPYLLLFIIPVIDFIALLTNELHHEYFVHYSIYHQESVLGWMFQVHTLFSYLFIVLGLFFLTRYSIKNSGFFSKQSILIQVGIAIPFVINILLTLKVLNLPIYYTPISFSIAIVCFSLAIIKLDFLNIAPIALQKIVDLISDSYIVVNRNFSIIDYNKTFMDAFSEVKGLRRKANLLTLMNENSYLGLNSDLLVDYGKQAIKAKETVSFERNIIGEKFNRFFMVEVTPIFINSVYTATIILLKDITQSKKDLETIKSTQEIIMEQERLSSLGQLIGGIAHNLRTPIMSLSGGIERLKDLTAEYAQSIGDASIEDADHREIAKEMDDWLEKMKPYCAYMSDIISTVKGLTTNSEESNLNTFTLKELIKRVDLLMKHELIVSNCVLNVTAEIDLKTTITGDISSLVQIFDNLIINSIHAYSEEHGIIELNLLSKDNNIIFRLTDYGVGMSKSVQEKLFKQMVTTKGNKGTGLGLYMSYATIKGRFNGDMWFTSEDGKGTTFYLSIPSTALFLKEEGLS